MLLLVFMYCKTIDSKNDADKEVFNSILKENLQNIIANNNEFAENLNSQKSIKTPKNPNLSNSHNSPAIWSVYITKTIKNECWLGISISIGINENILTGYTYIDTIPVFCYILSDSCNNQFINKDNLIEFKGSIPEYPNILIKPSPFLLYEGHDCIYKIENDNLILINVNRLNLDFEKNASTN
jgi:hypothetical protein